MMTMLQQNAKSVLSVLGACRNQEMRSNLSATGEDEKEAMDAMVSAIEDGLENKRILDGLCFQTGRFSIAM